MTFISRQCSSYLNSNNSLQLLHYQTLSGIGFNKLGVYAECICDPNNQYYLVEGVSNIFGKQAESNVFMSGVCFNRICSSSDLLYVMGSFEEYFKLPFTFNHVFSLNEIKPKYDAVTIIVLATLSILFLLSIVCSLVDLLHKKQIIKTNPWKIIDIFSVLTTLRLISSKSDRTTERVKTFSGIKTFCLMGIMITNLGIVTYKAPTTSFFAQTQDASIYIFFYAVDIWLMTSGFFLSYLLLKQYSKLKDFKILLLKIFRRFLRLWPIYLVGLFLFYNLIPLIGDGPLMPLLKQFSERQCSPFYTHIFMISNLFQNQCFNWLWLLEMDFQLCLIFVPILVLYLNGDKSAIQRYLFYGLQLIFSLSCVGAPFLMKLAQDQGIASYFFNEEYQSWNITPMIRSGGFVVGYNLGIVYYNFKKQQNKQHHWLIRRLQYASYRTVLPIIGCLGIIAISFFFRSLEKEHLSLHHFIFFTSLHTLIPILTCFIILPSLFGYCCPAKQILESGVCNLASKLSLPIYTLHFNITLLMIYNRQFDLELSNFTAIYLACCTVIPTLLVSVVLTTVVEIPVFMCKKKYWKADNLVYFEH